MNLLQQSAVALEARELTKSFPGVQALGGVDLKCTPGKVHALLGENGAGKSTLVGILTGNQQADGGRILVDGQGVHLADPRDALRHGITAVYQELTILPAMTILDNVMLGQEVRKHGRLQRGAQKAIAQEAMAKVGLGNIDLARPAGELSLANQQLVEIARALVRRSRIVILDEPSAVLSGDKLEALHSVVKSLAASGTAVIYITHLLSEIELLADDVTVLRDGRPVSSGAAADYDIAKIVRDMVGRTVQSAFPALNEPQEKVVLATEGLVPQNRSHDPQPLDLEVRAGEIVGIAGLVGSGRSRLLRTLAGIVPSETGRITVDGLQVGGSLHEAIKSGVVFVPEERKAEGLVLDLPVSANASLTVLRKVSRWGWMSSSAEKQVFAEEQQRLSIRASGPEQQTRQLSGGNQQKVVIAKWLRVAPKVLLLDEPTRGIDVGAKAEIYQLISDLARAGLAVVIVSSELIEVLGLAHRVLVCRDGSVVGEFPGGLGNEEQVIHMAMGGDKSNDHHDIHEMEG